MNEQLKPCPCGCEAKLIYVRGESYGLHLGEKYTSIKCSCCSFNANDFDDWNTRADGWIGVDVNPQSSGRFTVYSSYGVRDAFFTEGFVSGDFRWQDCQTGNDEGMENYDGIEFKVYNWMPLPNAPKAASCG